MSPVVTSTLRPSLSQSLLKLWIKQRQLLRVMDRQREIADLHSSTFAVEMVTDGYYLIRKNLSDLTDLHHELPLAAANDSLGAIRANETGSLQSTDDRTAHGILAHDIAALNDLAVDYAALHDEALSEKASALCAVVQQHGRQLKEFLSNLFPDHSPA
jgi:hypothetical protein